MVPLYTYHGTDDLLGYTFTLTKKCHGTTMILHDFYMQNIMVLFYKLVTLNV